MKPRIITGPFYFTRHATTGQLAATLPELHRSATWERAQIDEENRIVPIVFASEAPVQRWFGRERLICSPEAVRLGRMNNNAPLLSEHNREKQIGVVVKNSVTFADKMARAKIRFAKRGALAQEEWDNVLDEVRSSISVGYIVHKLVLREENEELGDLYDATDWEPIENSLVSVPADPNCTIDGRAETEDKHPVLILSETEQTTRSLTTMTRNARNYFARQMAPDTGANPQIPAAPKDDENHKRQLEEDRKNARLEAQKSETERIRELGALGMRYGIQDKAMEFITGNRSVQELKDYVMEEDIRPVAKRGAGNGQSGKDPLLTNGGEGGNQKPASRSIGEMIASSDTIKKYRENSGTRTMSFEIPGIDVRATFTSADIPAGQVAATATQAPLVGAIETRLTIADLMGQGQTDRASVHYMIETAPTNAATAVSEGGTKPEATFAFTDATAIVRKIAVIARVNDEALEDYNFLRSYIDNKLVYMVREREEALILNGDGVAPNILGILNTPNIQTQAKGTDTNLDALHKALTKIRVTGQAEPSGIVMHPNDAQLIFLAKDSNGQYMAGGPFYAPYGNGPFSRARSVWGLPLVETTAITQGTALAGAFRQYSTVWRRTGITVETTNSNGDDFSNNRTSIRVEERLVITVERPTAFCTVTGIA